MLQGREVHNSPPLAGAPQTKSDPSSGEGLEGAGGGESSDCKCVSNGRKPKGESLKVILLMNIMQMNIG